MTERAAHRCSGCGHRWSSPEGFILNGAELCGDCWRTAQAVLHAEPPIHRVTPPRLRGEPEPSCPTHGDPLVCLACEADENARPEWRGRADALADLRAEIEALPRVQVIKPNSGISYRSDDKLVESVMAWKAPFGDYVLITDVLALLTEKGQP